MSSETPNGVRQKGGPPSTEVALAACALLDDGKLHDWEFIVREVGKKIPPGIAIRRNEQIRVSASRGRARTRELSPERQIAAGRRAIVRDALRPPHFAFETRGGVRFVRLVSLPPRVARDRAAAETDRALDAAQLVAAARAGDNVSFRLDELTRPALSRVTLALVAHIADGSPL